MSRRVADLIPFFLVIAFLMGGFGCAVTESSGSSGPSQFAGTWSGTFVQTAPATPPAGTWTATVANDGTVTGTGTSMATGAFTLTGKVGENGVLSLALDDNSTEWYGNLAGTTATGNWSDRAAGRAMINLPMDVTTITVDTSAQDVGTFVGTKM